MSGVIILTTLRSHREDQLFMADVIIGIEFGGKFAEFAVARDRKWLTL